MIMRLPILIRALRLPFLSASILPFIAGTFLWHGHINWAGFFLGLIAVAGTHLAANLINDYADSRSGADWKDLKFYGFFGGSKLIQEEILPEGFYLKSSLFFSAAAFLAVILLAAGLKENRTILYYLFIIILGASYSVNPLRLSYRRLGEAVIFILFGPACVMGAYFIQSRVFPHVDSFVLALPFGLFTTAILVANEIADCSDDLKSKKYNLVTLTGQARGHLVYFALVEAGLFMVLINVIGANAHFIALSAFVVMGILRRSGFILKEYYQDKEKLLESSRLTIKAANLVYLLLIAGVILGRFNG
jgi:1,4-dihydroxy-2-naphthoate octaprenyltransferase